MRVFAIVILGFSLTACASAVRGTTEVVSIQVTPADANVTTDIGKNCTGSCDIKVKRKQEFTVTASKEGYVTQQQFVSTSTSKRGATGMAGNILLGGIIGVGVDAATGATLDHSPNPVILNLVPVGTSAPSPAPTSAPIPQAVPTS
ncbi:MAG: translation initiation factor 2 [Hyphomicrobiales bacterium]|nr:translation initiation factor 2 [Hyphomicrobiales bacterium]PCJ91222.1 MAG: translation initiation factor 2 [Hyphomicrobiales bacterium]